MNLAHFLPELAMNENLTIDDWSEIGKVVGTHLIEEINETINFFETMTHPSQKRIFESKTDMPTLTRWLVSITETCGPSGSRPIVQDGQYVYEVVHGVRRKKMEPIPEGDLAICYSNNQFTCHSIPEVLRQMERGDTINPVTEQEYPVKFLKTLKKRYGEVVAPEPREPKVEEIVIEVPRKGETPKKVRTPRKRPVRSKAKAFVEVEKIALPDDVWQIVTLFEPELDFVDEEGETRTIPLTANPKEKGVNVVVETFDAADPTTIVDLKPRKESAAIYVYGINAAGVKPKDQMIYNARVKKVLPKVKGIFYVSDMSEEGLKEALGDVVVAGA